MKTNKKIYFASDIHLGLPNFEESLKREKHFVNWLEMVRYDAEAIYLLGDIFDFWWEWKRVVPRGFTRLLGKLSEICDSGVPIHYFTGNHDIWVFDYLPKETGVIIHRGIFTTEIFEKKFYMAHGNGLGPGDYGYKLLHILFTSKFLQWGFSKLHPDWALWFGNTWSHNRRIAEKEIVFMGEKEWLIMHSREVLKSEHYDFFIYGHRHIPSVIKLNDTATYVNLGDWLVNNSYAIFDGETMEIIKFSTNRV